MANELPSLDMSQFGGAPPLDMSQFVTQPQPQAPQRGALGELGTAAERAALVGLPQSIGKSAQFIGHYLGGDDSWLSQAGQGMVSSAEARGAQPGLSLQPQGHSGMINTAANVIAGAGDYLPALAAGLAAPFTGGATAPLVAPLMAAGNVAGGLEAGEETREKLAKEGNQNAGAAGLGAAAATTAWNFLGGKVMSGVMNGVSNPLTKAIGNVVRGDGTAMFNDTWSQLTGTGGVVMPLLKQLAPTAAEMVGIGAGQAATQAGIEKLAGDPNAHPLDAALDAVGPSAMAGALMTVAGAPMRVVGNRAARGRTDLLTDAATPPEQRQQIAEQYAQALGTMDAQKAAAFRANAQTAIQNNLPLPIDSSVFTAGSVQLPAPSVVQPGANLAPQAMIDQSVGVAPPPPPLDAEGKPLTKAAFAGTPLAQDAQGQPLTGQKLAQAFKQYQADVKAHVNRQADIEAALNEPSGVRVQDENGVERELSMAELMNQRAGEPAASPAAATPAPVPTPTPEAAKPAEAVKPPEAAKATPEEPAAPPAPAPAPAPAPREPNAPKSMDEISADAHAVAQASDKGPLKAQDLKKLNEKLEAAGVFDAATHQEQIDALDDALQTTNSNTNYAARMRMLLDKWQTEMPKAPEPEMIREPYATPLPMPTDPAQRAQVDEYQALKDKLNSQGLSTQEYERMNELNPWSPTPEAIKQAADTAGLPPEVVEKWKGAYHATGYKQGTFDIDAIKGLHQVDQGEVAVWRAYGDGARAHEATRRIADAQPESIKGGYTFKAHADALQAEADRVNAEGQKEGTFENKLRVARSEAQMQELADRYNRMVSQEAKAGANEVVQHMAARRMTPEEIDKLRQDVANAPTREDALEVLDDANAKARERGKKLDQLRGAAPANDVLGTNIETPSPANSEPSPGTAQAMEEMGENNPPDTPYERAGKLIERLQSVLADFHTRNRNGDKIAAMPALEQERYGHAVDLKNGLAQIQQGRVKAPNENWWRSAEDTVGKLEKPLEAPLEKQGMPESTNPLRDQVAKGAPLADTLAHLAQNGSSDGAKALAQRLQDLNLKTTLHSNFLEARTAGRYSPQLDRIEINQGHESEPTVLHEATHAGLYSTIEQAKRIDQPANQREAQLKQAYRDWEEIRQNALRHTTAGEQYGLTNAQEFAAELMSRPEFQDFLKGLKADGSKASLWSRAVDTARRFLGMKVDERNALERAMDAANVMFDAAKNSREFDASPQGAVHALDATLEPLAKKADEWGTKVPIGAIKQPVLKEVLQWGTVDFIAHLTRTSPEMVASGFAKAVDAMRAARDSKRIVGRAITDPLGKYLTGVSRALKATGDYKLWRGRMMTIGGESSIGGFDYRMNYADNVKAGRQLDPSAKAWVDDVHRQFTQMKQAQPKLAEMLQQGELHYRKLLVQTNAVIAQNLLGATAGVVPRLEAELSRMPANDANRARLEQQLALRRTEADFVARHLGGLDIMGQDLKEVRNGDTAKHLDGASYALTDRLGKMFADANTSLPKGNALRAHLADMANAFSAQARNPYFSLGRDGDYYVKVAFKGKLDAQTQQKLNDALQGTNKILGNMDGQDRAFFRVKTSDQAQGLFNKLIAAGGNAIDTQNSERGLLEDKGALSAHGVNDALRQLQASIADGMELDKSLTPGQAEQMRETINRALLSMLPETSARSAKMQRRGVPGYDADFLGNFQRRAVGAAQELANLYTHRQFAAAVKGMADSARAMRAGPSIESAERAQLVANELNTRYQNGMTPLDNTAVNMLTSLGNSFYLALSPAFLIRTMAQPWHRGLPHLGSRFGYAPSAKAMAGATGTMMKIIQKSIAAGYREGGLRGALNTGMRFDDLGLSNEDAGFMHEMHDRGVLELGNAQQLQQLGRGSPQWQQDLSRLASATAQYAEMTNRGITGLAAFRLARKSGMSVEDATNFAHEATNTVMDNFDADNTARATGKFGKFGKVTPLTSMFMNFRLQTMQTIVRTVHDGLFSEALPGESAEQLAARKAQAGKEFAGLLATTTVLSGVMGLPFANAIAGLYNQARAWLDPDNPGDIRRDMRDHINRTFGNGAGDIIANGIGHLANVDTSTFGLQDLMPGSEFLVSRAKWQDRIQEEAQQLLGPAVNAGLDVFEGANKIYDGNYVKGIEAMLPSGLKPAYKAAELAGAIGPGGYTDSRGLPLGAPFDKASSWDVALQALGFRTSAKAIHDEAQADLSATQGQLETRRTVLDQQLLRGGMDPQMMQAAMSQVMAFNMANPTQPMTNIADVYRRFYMERAIGSMLGIGVPLTRRETPAAMQNFGYAAMPRGQ